MQVSEQFQKVVRAAIASTCVVVVTLLLLMWIETPARVSAQNAGTVGIAAIMVPVFSAQASTASSALFQDVGQGLNILFVCNSNFSGTIDLEWSPTGVAPFKPIVTATYSGDSTCHTITTGGYFPNLRSTVTFSSTGGGISVSAWYTASSGPVSFAAPAIGSSGPTSPVACDQNTSVSASTGATTWTTIGPINTGEVIHICAFSVSFNGATGAGTVQVTWGSSNACGSLVTNWQLDTLAATSQTLSFPIPLRQPVGRAFPCVQNSSGATAQVNISWASVHL